MNVRRAAAEDFDAIADLWRQFDHEIPPPTHEGPADEEQELGEVREIIASEIAFVAEDDGTPVGLRARASPGARVRDAHGPLRRARRAPERDRHGAHARGAGRVPRARDRAPRPRCAGVEQRRALALRALGAQGRGRDHDRHVARARGEARQPGGGVVRLDPHPVRRPERGRAGGAPVRPEASRRLARLARRAAARRLDRRLRRRVRPQPGDAPAARARALRQDGRRDLAARRRAGGARADDPLRAGTDRGRVPLGSGVLRPAAARRRRRPRCESDRRLAPDRRGSRGGAARARSPRRPRPTCRPRASSSPSSPW